MADETEKPDVPAAIAVPSRRRNRRVVHRRWRFGATGRFCWASSLPPNSFKARLADAKEIRQWRNWPTCRKRLPNDRGRHPSRPGRQLLLIETARRDAATALTSERTFIPHGCDR